MELKHNLIAWHFDRSWIAKKKKKKKAARTLNPQLHGMHILVWLVSIPYAIYLCMKIHTHPEGAYGKAIISHLMQCSTFLRCNYNGNDWRLKSRAECSGHVCDLGPWSAAAAPFNEELSSVDGIYSLSSFLLLAGIIINSNCKPLCVQYMLKLFNYSQDQKVPWCVTLRERKAYMKWYMSKGPRYRSTT